MTTDRRKVVDLRDFEDEFKLDWDQSRRGLERDPWLLRVPCRGGHIAPNGERTLAVWLERRPKIISEVVDEIATAKVRQRGDNEAIISFDVVEFCHVAAIVGAARRRKLTKEQKEMRLARLNSGNGKLPEEGGFSTQGSVRTTSDDANPVPAPRRDSRVRKRG